MVYVRLDSDQKIILVARKCFTLMSKTFNIEADIVVRKNMTNGSTSYFMRWAGEELLAVKNALVQAVCCKRAYIRGHSSQQDR